MPLSTFLNGRGITRPRGLMWLGLTEQAIIQSGTITSDAGGGGTATWDAKGTTVCRVYPVTIRGKGALVGGQVNERSTHFCSMPPDTDINTADRIVVGSRGKFEVTMVLETTDAFTTRVECIEISS